jgi:plastocyanin
VKRALRVAATALACFGVLAAVAPAVPEDAHVSILYSSLSEPRTVVLAGDTVHWLNVSTRTHTVTSRDGLFDSDLIPSHSGFARLFDTPGTFLYACKIHPSIAGEVDAYPLLLSGPAAAVLTGSQVALTGRAQAGVTSVSIERQDPSGFTGVASAPVGADGSFTAQVTPRATSSYRAVSGNLASPALQVNVTDRRDLTVKAKRAGGGTRLSVRVQPPDPGARVALQLYLRERFGWWTVARRELSSESAARFAVRRRGSRRARVVLLGGDGITPVAVSAAVRFRNRG